MYTKWIVLFMCFFCFTSVCAGSLTSKLVDALIAVETPAVPGGDDSAIGDTTLTQKAYGCLQIRQCCVDDVNETCGTHYRAEDCLGNRTLSLWICEQYLARYATKKRLGHEPTDEDRARIWNGGPEGWRKSSTKGYWKKVKKHL